MNQSDWVKTIQLISGLTLDQSRMAVDDIFKNVANALLAGEKVVLPLIGSLKIVPSAARRGYSPKTGATVDVPAGERVKLTAGRTIKAQLAERNQQNRKAA